MPYYSLDTAIDHLRDCLKLQNNIACLNVLIDNILQVGERHLDISSPASAQKNVRAAIREELKELYPDVFSDEDSENRNYIAVQIILRNHRSKRSGLKKKMKQRKVNKVGRSHHQEKAGTPASKLDSKKYHTRSSLSSRRQNSNIPNVRHLSLTPAPGSYHQNKNQAPTQLTIHATAKASDTRSASIISLTDSLPSTPKQVSDMQDEEDQTSMSVTDKVSDNTKTTNIRRSPSLSIQGPDEHDEDHVPVDVTMHEVDVVSDNNKAKNVPDIRRSVSTPSQQGFDEQLENQAPMDVRTHATDKALGTMGTKRIINSRRSSAIPTHEQDEDQAPMNLTMHTMNKTSDGGKAKMPLAERMASSLTSIANIPSTPRSPSLRVHASQPSGSLPTPFSQPRRHALFVPHISKSQSQPNETPSQPRSTSDDPFHRNSSISMSRPVTYSTSADTSSNLSMSKDGPKNGPMRGSAVSQGHEFASLHHFLESCVPSMSYLLPRFINYGCDHEGYLLTVSMWPPERIKKFLENVATDPDGQMISPMEQMILYNHLAHYFKA